MGFKFSVNNLPLVKYQINNATNCNINYEQNQDALSEHQKKQLPKPPIPPVFVLANVNQKNGRLLDCIKYYKIQLDLFH
jgi:hypothetical protein